jgi:hypothetical protein
MRGSGSNIAVAAGSVIHTQELLLLVFAKKRVCDRGNVDYKEKLE